MRYVFRRSQVRMMMPSRLSCSPRSRLSSTAACSILFIVTLRACSALRVGQHRSSIVNLHARRVPDGANRLIAARDDLVAFLQTAQHLDIGCAGDAGFDFAELSTAVVHDKNALKLHSPGPVVGRFGSRLHALFWPLEISFLSDRQRLDRNREHVAPRGGGDLGGASESWTNFVRRVLQRDHDLEIFGLLVRCRTLGCG